MSTPSHDKTAGTYFITTATCNRRRLFQVTANAELFVATLQRYRHKGCYKLHAFVVMPDHVHLLLTTQDSTLERCIGFIKGGFSHEIHSSFPVWQHGYTSHHVRDARDYNFRKSYLHENPVKAGLCATASDYPHSSAYRPALPSAAEADPLGSNVLRHG
jgi:putative transposase